MAKNTTKRNADGSITITNVHGSFTAASESAIEYMLSTATQHSGLAKRLFEVYDADGASPYPMSHFRRYSERTLAIMLCDVYADDVAEALSRIEARTE